MEVNKDRIECEDSTGFSHSINIVNGGLNLYLDSSSDGSAFFTREQIKELLPHLQAFVKKGSFEVNR